MNPEERTRGRPPQWQPPPNQFLPGLPPPYPGGFQGPPPRAPGYSIDGQSRPAEALSTQAVNQPPPPPGISNPVPQLSRPPPHAGHPQPHSLPSQPTAQPPGMPPGYPPPPPFGSPWNHAYPPPIRFDRPPPPIPGHHFAPPPHWRQPPTQSYNYQNQRVQIPSGVSENIFGNKTENEKPPEQTEDQKWLQKFIEERNITKASNRRPSPTISGAFQQFKRAKTLLVELEASNDDLAHSTQVSSIEWDQKMSKVKLLKDELNELRENLDLDMLKKKYQRILKKRARLKRQRLERYHEKLEEEERRRAQNEELDQWLAAFQEKQLEKKREKDMKEAADETLSEVRKKLSEARKCKDVLERLTKLRQVRKDAMERMGLYTAKESDTNFVSRRDKLGEVMDSQLKVYENEEMALKVMLEAEAEESKEKIKEQTSASKEKYEMRLKNRLKHLLFGLNDVPDISDKIRPFYDYHTAAQSNLHMFLNVRQQWDAYIVPEGTPGASSVPVGWVIPSAPSSELWETALKNSTGKS